MDVLRRIGLAGIANGKSEHFKNKGGKFLR